MNYREKRKGILEKLAVNIAQKVRNSKKPYILEEMNPYERRIIHMTMEKENDIETFSLGRGKGNLKRIKISLKGQFRSNQKNINNT